MPIFVYPNSQDALLTLTQHCEAMSLPPPRCWDESCLDRLVEDLLADESACPPKDFQVCADAAEIADPVVVFCGMGQHKIRQLIQLYRAAGEWPIFAVITPQSREMTLRCLFGHLLEDRQKEEQIKTQRLELQDIQKS